MLAPRAADLIAALHAVPHQLVYVSAGGGAQALTELLAVAGASRTLLEARVPYAVRAFDDFLEATPAKYVAVGTALRLAGRALVRAQALAPDSAPLIGAACSASIATDRPKRGPHQACIATWTRERAVSYHLTLAKGARTRGGEEQLISHLVLNALAAAADLPQRLPLAMLPDETLTHATHDFATPAAQLLAGRRSFFAVHAGGRVRTAGVQPQVLLSGAFNPLHAGHLALAQAAGELLGKPVAFEMAAVNADKPPLAQATLLARLAQFAGRWPVYMTAAPTFIEKARLFPGALFVVGYDTAARVIAPRYYGDSADAMRAALDEMLGLGNRFLVAGRVNADGVYHTLADLALPPGRAALFSALPDFRLDISSTELRAARG